MSEQVVDKDGFGHWVGKNTSELTCPCGSRFEWEGFSDDLEPWRTKHKPHVEGRVPVKAKSDVKVSLSLEEALALDFAFGNSMDSGDDEDLFPDPMERGVAWRARQKLKEAIKTARKS